MRQNYIYGGAPTTLDSTDDLLHHQQSILNDIQTRANPENATAADTANTSIDLMYTGAENGINDIEAEIIALFENDQELAAILNTPQPAAKEPIPPLDIDELNRSFGNTGQQTESQSENTGFISPEPQKPVTPRAAEEVLRFTGKDPGLSPRISGNKDQAGETVMTDKQLRALSRKHLLMMIRDLEKELEQLKEEINRMLLAYEAGNAQGFRAS